MRLKIAIVLAILGLLVLGTGIGQRTIWLPPATVTASAPAEIAPAPLTVIGPDLLKTRDGQFTMTIKSDGPMQLAVAREDDILGWIGDAAYTRIGAADAEFTQLASKSNAGQATVPNPAGSDMWVSEEKATGELSYTWQAPGHGDWALLLSVDGKAAAPTGISITVDNEAGTPWAVPLMVVGSALLALAALMFLIAPNKNKAAVAGRRSAGRVPSDPATGALEVEKIVSASEAAKKDNGPATISEAGKTVATSDKAGADASGDGSTAAAKPAASDATSALPAILSDGAPALEKNKARTDKAQAGKSQTAGTAADTAAKTGDARAAKPGEEPEKSVPGLSGEAGAAPKPESKSGKKSGKKSEKNSKNNSDDDPSETRPPEDGTSDDSDGGASSKAASESGAGTGAKPADTKGKNKDEFRAAKGGTGLLKRSMGTPARWGAVLAAVLVSGSLSPAVADESASPTPPAASASATATAVATEEAANPGFPSLLDSQVQRIASAVATAVAAGDTAKNAKQLETRVTGMALDSRAANYKIRSKVSKQAAMEPVNATPLLAKVVTTTATWPRSAMFVTQGENNALPQLLTLIQESPRENYKLVQATPLLPGQTFPKVDREGTKEVPADAADGLLMSPKDAVAALSDRLTKSDSKFKDSFNDSVYIQSVLDTQAAIVKDAKDASYVFSHKANADEAVNLRTADGGVMVVAGFTFGIDATSKEDATLTVGDDAAVFTGGKETTKGFNLSYAEPVVIYIPAAGADKKITILSATRNLVGGSFKK